MQSIGFLARKVLADAKRAMEAREKEKQLAGGLSGPAKIQKSKNVCPCVFLENAADSESVGLGSLDRCPPVNAAEGRNSSDHTTLARESAGGLVAGGVSGPVETREEFAMRPPAQPSAGSYGEGFTVEAEGIARNVR